MASNCQIERLLPLLGMIGVGLGIKIVVSFPVSGKQFSTVSFQIRKIVRDFDNFIKEHTSPKKDYVACLPDEILCHIISCLDMKNAVRTSVLSRRWRKLYCTLSNPKFECHKMFESVTITAHNNCHLNCKHRFVNCVDNCLRLRSILPMESFTLRFGPMWQFPKHLQRWLDCVIMFGVRKLDLNFCCNDELLAVPNTNLIVFPFKILSSACLLEYVQLSFCILEPNFQGPFNSLKELALCFVPLVNGEVESILSSCPQLWLLNLRYCKLPYKLLVNALKLRTLKIFHCQQVNEIGFSASNLDYFAYFGKSSLIFSPSYVPNLGRLCLGLECDNKPPDGFVRFLHDTPCLHTLWIEATPDQVRYIQTEMPTLSDVNWLSLHVISNSLDLRDIISLIALCPNLSRFDLSSLLCSLSYTKRYAEVLPTCLHLKLVVLDGFKCYAAQKKFASQLIRCAPALEAMNIYTAYCLYPLGRMVEETLPLGRRVFSPELISRTRRVLQEQASSSASVNLNLRLANPSRYGIVPDEEDIADPRVVSRQINCVVPKFVEQIKARVEQIKALVGQIDAPEFVKALIGKIYEIDVVTLEWIILGAAIVIGGGVIYSSVVKVVKAVNDTKKAWNEACNKASEAWKGGQKDTSDRVSREWKIKLFLFDVFAALSDELLRNDDFQFTDFIHFLS